ncbi:MAG: hypothetical protein IJV15_07115 [Lachnospiraceae bacterium]|nr:hypothetical protein [Lachnospiraceae bacterium]
MILPHVVVSGCLFIFLNIIICFIKYYPNKEYYCLGQFSFLMADAGKLAAWCVLYDFLYGDKSF